MLGEEVHSAAATSPRTTARHDDLALSIWGERLVRVGSARDGGAFGLLPFFSFVFFFSAAADRCADSIVFHCVAFNCLFTHSAVGGGVGVFAFQPNYSSFPLNTHLFFFSPKDEPLFSCDY